MVRSITSITPVISGTVRYEIRTLPNDRTTCSMYININPWISMLLLISITPLLLILAASIVAMINDAPEIVTFN